MSSYDSLLRIYAGHPAGILAACGVAEAQDDVLVADYLRASSVLRFDFDVRHAIVLSSLRRVNDNEDDPREPFVSGFCHGVAGAPVLSTPAAHPTCVVLLQHMPRGSFIGQTPGSVALDHFLGQLKCGGDLLGWAPLDLARAEHRAG